ncbi:MAG: dihydrofolate reductase [Candidatus Harrisonbacteria bacterium CG10_big_fil_rev_8_21_14_0_10_49_15]|uniref:Dihydrofolate reductase n=1 Tax=Candidatus Harrisonbacteria bacterium CG10_big_fil_rev_8_21_14_0_10_49_15 TaxID=1974587 RepID=A0A2H0UKF1_9BACT|nr:MAG: dihydrofolate reductase [Candidatus Harrisonbacteria bacterium CG10_big_fil_rev_8_21_14_0_10_49_15]
MLILVAALAENNAIGKENDLPWYLPEDLKHFKKITSGKTVLMGRKTFESIVARLGKPLPNRTNIVITRQQNYTPGHPERSEGSRDSLPAGRQVRYVPQNDGWDSVEVYPSVEDAVKAHPDEDIYGIGGGQIFDQTICDAGRMYLTHVHQNVEGADAFFPEIKTDEWRETEREDHEGYSFVTYERA